MSAAAVDGYLRGAVAYTQPCTAPILASGRTEPQRSSAASQRRSNGCRAGNRARDQARSRAAEPVIDMFEAMRQGAEIGTTEGGVGAQAMARARRRAKATERTTRLNHGSKISRRPPGRRTRADPQMVQTSVTAPWWSQWSPWGWCRCPSTR